LAYNTGTQNIPEIIDGTFYEMNQTTGMGNSSMLDLAGDKITLLGDGWYRILFWTTVIPFVGGLFAVLTENPTTGWGSGLIRAVDWEEGSGFFETRIELEGVYEFSAGDTLQIHLTTLSPDRTVTTVSASSLELNNGLYVERLA